MAYLLHIDTSGETGLVALNHDGVMVSSITNADTRNHAATLNLHIDKVLADADITMQQLNAVVVCGGPGSYTGLRIGLATAKGLCYILGIPLMMHDKLRLISLKQFYDFFNEYDFYVSLLPAREKEYYLASYNNKSENVIAPQHIMEDHLPGVKSTINGKILLVADINEAINNIFSAPNNFLSSETVIDITAWARYSYEQYNCNNFVNLEYSEPFYLKPVYTHKQKTIN